MGIGIDLFKHDGFDMFYSNIMGYTVTQKETVGGTVGVWSDPILFGAKKLWRKVPDTKMEKA